MIALYIILGVLLFLLLLTLLPVRVDLSFREEFTLKIGYLFFRFPVLPGKEETEEEEKKEAGEKEEQKEKPGEGAAEKVKRILKRKGFRGFLESLFELIGLAANAGKKIVRKIRLKRFDLYLCLGGREDPAETAQLYGKLCGPVYGACSALFSLTGAPRSRRRPKKAVTLDIDYGSSENLVDFSARLSFKPFTLLKEGIILLVKGLPAALRLLRSAKAPKPAPGTELSSNEKGETS